jgi:hypothetical protein
MDEQSSVGEPSEQGTGRASVIEMDVGDEDLRDVAEAKACVRDGALEHRKGRARAGLDKRVAVRSRDEIGSNDARRALKE